jgi:BioD-like phosphotransacetylase family protein
MILEYFPKALEKYGIPLVGCVPFSTYLSTHSMEDFEWLFQAKLLSGEPYRHHHFRRTRLVAGSLQSYLDEEVPNELVITPASREDIIDTILSRYKNPVGPDDSLHIGLLLTGRRPPSKNTLQRIKKSLIPTIYVPMCSYNAMKMLTSFIAKTRKEDERKVAKAIEIVEHTIDFNLLCQKDFATMT